MIQTTKLPLHVFQSCALLRILTLFDRQRRTVLGGIAHAQSLHRLPCEQAFPTSPGEQSVTPTHIIYESTSRVTCKATAGREGSDGAKYRVSTDIMVVVKPKLACLIVFAWFPFLCKIPVNHDNTDACSVSSSSNASYSFRLSCRLRRRSKMLYTWPRSCFTHKSHFSQS